MPRKAKLRHEDGAEDETEPEETETEDEAEAEAEEPSDDTAEADESVSE